MLHSNESTYAAGSSAGGEGSDEEVEIEIHSRHSDCVVCGGGCGGASNVRLLNNPF